MFFVANPGGVEGGEGVGRGGGDSGGCSGVGGALGVLCCDGTGELFWDDTAPDRQARITQPRTTRENTARGASNFRPPAVVSAARPDPSL